MTIVYTDGACLGNPGPGGWAVLFQSSGLEVKGVEPFTTNNRMELKAVIEALKITSFPCTIVSDSTYVVNSFSKGWVHRWETQGFKKKKNVDLWKEILELTKDKDVTFKWVKGHGDDQYNIYCDELATKAIYENK